MKVFADTKKYLYFFELETQIKKKHIILSTPDMKQITDFCSRHNIKVSKPEPQDEPKTFTFSFLLDNEAYDTLRELEELI